MRIINRPIITVGNHMTVVNHAYYTFIPYQSYVLPYSCLFYNINIFLSLNGTCSYAAVVMSLCLKM